MRAANLLPTEVRTSGLSGSVSRSHILLGALAAVLLAVVSVILTNNKISDREADVARLQQEEQTAKAKADALQSFSSFASMQQLRTTTVKSLAESRFDWERVMRELALVLPGDVWLTKLTGTVVPDVQIDGASGVSARSSIPGPALEIVGCAPGQESVATFVAALEDVDGVTRVGVQSSKLPENTLPAGAPAAAGPSSDDCRTRDFISKFEIVVAFDAAPAAAVAGGAIPATPAPSTGQQPQAAEVPGG